MKEGANPGMDGLKKLVAGRLATVAVEQHPDADVLTAFAEHALSDVEREQVLHHLGACKDCRETLHLAAEHSPEAQPVLSFQPKRRPSLMFRWGAVAASVVIVGAAVITRYPARQAVQYSQKPAAPPVENYSKVAEEKTPPDVRGMRDRLAPASTPPIKERPAEKHMTAKPRANMEFDGTDQVHVAGSPRLDEDKKKADQPLTVMGRNTLPLPAASQAQASGQGANELQLADKDQRQTGADVGYAARAAKQKSLHGNLSGVIQGTVVDPSGALVNNAKVTMNGPVGSKTATSDAQGNFVFSSLASGSYSIKTEAAGFKSSEIADVAVADDKPAAVGVRLEPGSASETVEVSAAAVSANVGAAAEVETAPARAGTVGGPITGSLQQNTVTNNTPAMMKMVSIPQWRLSVDGIVQRSFDVGGSWQNVTVSKKAVFTVLCTVKQHVWVGGKGGMLFHSVDAGQSWQHVRPSEANEKLSSDVTHIDFPDPSNGSVSASNGEVWSTSDGGRTWRRQ